MNALALTESTNHPIEYPDIIIEKILHQLGTNQNHPVNVTQLSTTLGYSQLAIQVAASILKDQHINLVTEKVLDLRPKIDVAFDAIRQNINALESSLSPSVCIGDFGVLDVQNALQVFIDLCITFNFEDRVVPSIDLRKNSRESVASSIYCLSSAIKTFITSTSRIKKEFISNQIMISGVRAIVESVLSIIDVVLRGLKEMKGREQIFDNENLIGFTSAMANLISQRVHPFDDDVITPFTVIAHTTKTNVENLPLIMVANIELLLQDISTQQEKIPSFYSAVDPIRRLRSHLRQLSQSVRSIHINANLTASSVDTSSHNLITTISYLTSSVAALQLELLYIREFHELIEPNLQANLLFITSNLRTLSDEITVIVERGLIDLICTSSSMEKTNLQKLSLELQSSIEAIILTYERVVNSSIETVRSHMYCVFTIIDRYDIPEYDTAAQILFSDTKQLIGELDRILSNDTSTNPLTNFNAFTICAKAFEEAAQSSIKLRTFLQKSVDQIKRYLL